MKFFLGMDMSCYTTSCAVADEEGNIIYDSRRPLVVPAGKKGLRQQEMVFLHIKQVREVFPDGYPFAAVAVSISPRDIEGSYMPVFAACESFGQVAAQASGAEFYRLTHQHGHIAAALIGNEMPDRFLALHVSGGTTDVCAVEKENGVIKKITTLGETADIAAGQFIDRVGTALGVPFPCGPHLEKLAEEGKAESLRATFYDMNVSFSGPESALLRKIEKGMTKEDAAATVQHCIAKVLIELIHRAQKETGIKPVLLSGGVMSNAWITARIAEDTGAKFAARKYSPDNACGLASLARNIYMENQQITF